MCLRPAGLSGGPNRWWQLGLFFWEVKIGHPHHGERPATHTGDCKSFAGRPEPIRRAVLSSETKTL